MSFNETIFALASGRGRAGVAVVRISGPGAFDALERISAKPLPKARSATLCQIYRSSDKSVIDQILSITFPGPNSFTGEDVVELHLHGSPAILTAVFEELVLLPAFRPALPGEFTRRAFEHGKMDLTEAEGLGDLVNAETDAQARQALRQMQGELGRLYEGWRSSLVSSLAHLEADIDFPDEDLPDGVAKAISPKIAHLRREIEEHLADGHRGEKIRDGLNVVILGQPNVGKSSLLNVLARKEAAIVSDEAGTTRDIIEVPMDLAGYPVTIADTAGLRDSGNKIEQEGVRRARDRAKTADIRLFMTTAETPDIPEEFIDLVEESDFRLINKTDILDQKVEDNPDSRIFALSVKTGKGIEAFLSALEADVTNRLDLSGAPALTRIRHRQALEECVAALQRFEGAQESELAAEDTRLAVRALGRITGRVDVEDILDVIFGDFCIGK
ncbi:tRNA uridine-5-carboxymethylaminomethyl(34) synthesis GTPase MnmE [Sneathiella litorea]|uniref:tRNA modification GTPase MnmE n=1 Tax=Sneathiella litorea TaxID=2606216 RepID=A0A6L8W5N0_9PROT|nr:tRNA uridine-5-carboxymethylaminomethyl(34) synthesis GTPase MnmE [Sneathiella litorea]MZR29793.1 tRNA uridine-5-carboxymethylaminomethyl(34) synthesis GTPase MnmE [Sneathiella litorea]